MTSTPLLVTHFHTYKRHRPELVHHYPELLEQISRQGQSMPRHVEKKLEEFLKCAAV